MKIAVIGGGIAGLGAAWALSRQHSVSLYEADRRPGGHANTVDVNIEGRAIAVDTGFIVYNERNYPSFSRLLAQLGIRGRPSTMSFSASLAGGAFEYAGNAVGLLAAPGNLLRRRFWRMLADLPRFNRLARDFIAGPGDDSLTIADFARASGLSDAFMRSYLLPMAAAIWSARLDDIGGYPAASLLGFFANHGLLRLSGRPQWLTIAGGSREYVERLAGKLAGSLLLGRPVRAVERQPDGVVVHDAAGQSLRYDQAVFATHAPQTLRLLGGTATAAERRILGAFRYQRNLAVLHKDPRLMPRRRRAWASWNYLEAGPDGSRNPVAVTYWMNRLQGLDCRAQLFVSLNPQIEPEPARVIAAFDYEHPQFDRGALAAQRLLPTLQGLRRSWFCGGYCGHGFHEDALTSGLEVAARLASPVLWDAAPGWSAPALAAA
jgi:predicted NAD/FAD-binding protein